MLVSTSERLSSWGYFYPASAHQWNLYGLVLWSNSRKGFNCSPRKLHLPIGWPLRCLLCRVKAACLLRWSCFRGFVGSLLWSLFRLLVGSVLIPFTKLGKDLGILINTKLRFHDYISCVAGRASGVLCNSF